MSSEKKENVGRWKYEVQRGGGRVSEVFADWCTVRKPGTLLFICEEDGIDPELTGGVVVMAIAAGRWESVTREGKR